MLIQSTAGLQARLNESGRAFFSSPPAQITYCAEKLKTKEAVLEVTVHELTHARDV